MCVLTVLLVAVHVGFRVAIVVDLDLCDSELWRRLGRAVVQQLLQLLLVQFTGGCWEEERMETFDKSSSNRNAVHFLMFCSPA